MATDSKDEKDYSFELYKSLRAEAVSYVEKVPGLWLQKFILSGGIIGFLIAKHHDIVSVTAGEIIFGLSYGGIIVGAAIVFVPLLALLLDAKMMEYGLHARAISRFLAQKYPTPSVLAEWEASLWGDSGTLTPGPTARFHSADLARFRSALTILATVVPTALLICLAGIMLSVMTKNWIPFMIVAGAAALLYLVSAVAAWFYLWPSKSR